MVWVQIRPPDSGFVAAFTRRMIRAPSAPGGAGAPSRAGATAQPVEQQIDSHRRHLGLMLGVGRLWLWHGWPVDGDGRALMQQVRARAKETVDQVPIKRVHPTADRHRAAARGHV